MQDLDVWKKIMDLVVKVPSDYTVTFQMLREYGLAVRLKVYGFSCQMTAGRSNTKRLRLIISSKTGSLWS
jgi:hypothetical protein